ncbi:hypothetical protein FACS189434_10060 [Bacteroidia bacterium]|nr:hypothetical protein FACS189434_10060 [Bacteroidia bacterium]
MFSQEKHVLQAGTVNLISYTIDGVEQSNNIKYLNINSKENGFYELKIKYKNGGDNHEYITFKIENIVRKGNKQTGQLKEMVLEDTASWAYYDGDAVGTIEIDYKNKLTTIEILYHFSKYSQANYKIVWKNE